MPANDSRDSAKLHWLVPFFGLELAIAVGALLGVALLDLRWLWGLGMGNLVILTFLGVIPSAMVTSLIQEQRRMGRGKLTVVVCFGTFIIATGVSHYFGIAVTGI